MNIFFPINISRWNNPISSKMREIILHTYSKDVHFFTFSDPVTEEDKYNSDVLNHQDNLTIINKWGLFENRFDIVHKSSATNKNMAMTYLAKLKNIGPIKDIFTVSTQLDNKLDKFRKLSLKAIQKADHVLCNSHFTATNLRSIGVQVDDVIYNGVDSQFFDVAKADEKTLKQYNVKGGYFIFIGTLTRTKRPDIILSLAKAMPQHRFLMVGRTSIYKESFWDELPNNVQYLGEIPKAHARDLLAFSKALLFPSELEGLPNAVLEAMSMGVPVLGQKATSMPELIIDDLNGWLADYNENTWVERLKFISHWDQNQSEEFKRRSRGYTISKFSWEEYADRHQKFYNSIV